MSAPLSPDALRTFQLLNKVKGAALPEDHQREMQRLESDIEGKQAAILVVEDAPAPRMLMLAILRSLGYHNLAEASNGQDALTLLRARPFDLMILDMEMPIMNGFAVLTELKQDPALSRLAVIVASGLQELEAVVRCIEL